MEDATFSEKINATMDSGATPDAKRYTFRLVRVSVLPAPATMRGKRLWFCR